MKLGDLPILPERASAAAQAVDGVALAVFVVCTLLALGILVAIVFLLIRYRESNTGVDRSNPPSSLLPLEWGWIAAATLIGLLLFWLGARTYYQLYTMPAQAELELEVVGKQWMWKIRYPNGYKTINRLVVPKGKKVLLRMISEDVIHSFDLPEFRVKHDVLPGRYSELWLDADRVGVFHLFCAEYCGTDHAKMGGQVEVLEPEDFVAWLQATTGDSLSPVARGKVLFDKFGCAGCHSQNRAPRLPGAYGNRVALEDGTTVTMDEDYIRNSILYPARQVVAGFAPSIMPTYEGRLSEQQILDLIAFIREGNSE
ncbi:MAG: cytochrome c oxidase subunit II [Candidatus Eremiobacteraeota bacterium]|nr:cytochrome c oxidase subunit II [Candidatus Eremiobacteraeota bacterium]